MAAEESARTATTVLMTADVVGGVWQYSLELAAGLAEQGLGVHLATMGPRPTTEQRRAAEAVPGVTLHESDYLLEWMPGGIADFQASGEWLLELQAQSRAQLVHLNGYSHASLDWPVPTISVAHSCVFSWWRSVHGQAPGAEWLPYYEAVAAGLAQAAAVVTPSHFMAKALEQEYGFDQKSVRVIHNASSDPVDDAAAKQPFALAAGRLWDEAKNLPLLGDIAPQLDWPVRIAGDGADPAGSSADTGAVQTLGKLSRAALLKKMRAASLFLHPALYEPFGLAVLEAARARCCLVLANIPSLRELWDGCAEFVHPQDAEQWTFEINRLIRNRADREKFAQRAAVHSKRYQRERMISQYQALYQSLLALPFLRQGLPPVTGNQTEGATA